MVLVSAAFVVGLNGVCGVTMRVKLRKTGFTEAVVVVLLEAEDDDDEDPDPELPEVLPELDPDEPEELEEVDELEELEELLEPVVVDLDVDPALDFEDDLLLLLLLEAEAFAVPPLVPP